MNRFAGLVQRLTLVTILGAGCSGERRAPPRDASGKVAAATSLVAGPRVDHVDQLAREPMVVQHPSGALFVSGYGPPRPMLWRSSDRGATWSRVDVGTEADGAIGNSDVDLAVGPDGTLYFITMLFDRAKSEGRHVVIGVSHDVGTSWKWTTLSKTRFDDRPWVEVAPDGRVHVIWNDGSGVCYATSRDRGATWTEGPESTIRAARATSRSAPRGRSRCGSRRYPPRATNSTRESTWSR